MAARCGICGELIAAKSAAQFFLEDDSYVCGACKREHQQSLEKMKKPSIRKSTIVTPAFAE